MLGHSRLSLLFGADEEDRSTVGHEIADIPGGLGHLLDGLAKVHDVDPVALPVDIGTHLGIPATGLMPEVDPSLQELLHCDCSHNCSFLVCASVCRKNPLDSASALFRDMPDQRGSTDVFDDRDCTVSRFAWVIAVPSAVREGCYRIGRLLCCQPQEGSPSRL